MHKPTRIDSRLRQQLRDALTKAAALCSLLESDSAVGRLQRRCLTDDVRTKRNLAYLHRTCGRLSRLIDDRP